MPSGIAVVLTCILVDYTNYLSKHKRVLREINILKNDFEKSGYRVCVSREDGTVLRRPVVVHVDALLEGQIIIPPFRDISTKEYISTFSPEDSVEAGQE